MSAVEIMSYKKVLIPLLRSTSRQMSSGGSRPTISEIRARRNELFSREKARQLSLISRVEKIQVEHKGPPEDCTLLMNKNLSTPFNVAMHIQELLMSRSVIALVNGKPWDMHRPLEEDCEIQFQHFQDQNPHLSNIAFWKSCSFMLGHVLETAFKEQYNVELCSFPAPDVESGSFVYDVRLDVENWKPTMAELNCLSRLGTRLGLEDKKFERLDIDASLAMDMFEHNRFKQSQIPDIAAKSESGSTVTVYRMGDHVDISRGPLISNTGLVYRFSVCGLHPIESPNLGPLTRVQGMAIPKQMRVHFWSYEFLCDRAAKYNPAPLPTIDMKGSDMRNRSEVPVS